SVAPASPMFPTEREPTIVPAGPEAVEPVGAGEAGRAPGGDRPNTETWDSFPPGLVGAVLMPPVAWAYSGRYPPATTFTSPMNSVVSGVPIVPNARLFTASRSTRYVFSGEVAPLMLTP